MTVHAGTWASVRRSVRSATAVAALLASLVATQCSSGAQLRYGSLYGDFENVLLGGSGPRDCSMGNTFSSYEAGMTVRLLDGDDRVIHESELRNPKDAAELGRAFRDPNGSGPGTPQEEADELWRVMADQEGQYACVLVFDAAGSSGDLAALEVVQSDGDEEPYRFSRDSLEFDGDVVTAAIGP
jgi:hypothetical protein